MISNCTNKTANLIMITIKSHIRHQNDKITSERPILFTDLTIILSSDISN